MASADPCGLSRVFLPVQTLRLAVSRVMPGKAWRPEEDALVYDVTLSLQEVSDRLDRPLKGVQNRAWRLGVQRKLPSDIDWADSDQVKQLKRERYGKGTAEHSPRLGRLVDAELNLLRDTSLTYAEIAERTGWPVRVAEYKAKRLGIERLPDYEDWAPEELALFEDRSLQFPDIAELTGRSREAVKVKANRLGEHKRRYWAQDGYVPDSNDYRGRGWKKLRLQVLERDDYICQDGGEFIPSGEGLVVHHVIPWRLRQVNDLRFLVTLCRSHHMQRPEHAWTEIPENVLL